MRQDSASQEHPSRLRPQACPKSIPADIYPSRWLRPEWEGHLVQKDKTRLVTHKKPLRAPSQTSPGAATTQILRDFPVYIPPAPSTPGSLNFPQVPDIKHS